MAILKPQYERGTIRRISRALYTSDSALTFCEKIGYSFGRQSPSFLRDEEYSICCGGNPWLGARLVKELYVQSYPDTVWRQTLHWAEHARTCEDPETFEIGVVFPERQCYENVEFNRSWYGHSFLEEDARGYSEAVGLSFRCQTRCAAQSGTVLIERKSLNFRLTYRDTSRGAP